jgi:predicted RNA-binding Zn-ribbon protein involved in translation (DUF1610 family)
MKWVKSSWPFIIITIIGLSILIFSIYDIIYDKDWMIRTFAAWGLLVVITIVVIFFRLKKEEAPAATLEEFEKTLKGGLYHFKCPTCSGIFAIKKSKSDNKKFVKMTCPDCGTMGTIPPNPAQIEEEIPEKKSIKANFKCNVCGEGITVWAEGTELYKKMIVHSCPFCGEEEPLKRI